MSIGHHGVTRPAAPKPDAAVAVIATSTLRAIYTRVGEAIEDLRKTKGDAAAAAFKKKYLDLPFGDAQNNPALRPDLVRKLEQLERELKAQK